MLICKAPLAVTCVYKRNIAKGILGCGQKHTECIYAADAKKAKEEIDNVIAMEA